jgi:hypothetical protein
MTPPKKRVSGSGLKPRTKAERSVSEDVDYQMGALLVGATSNGMNAEKPVSKDSNHQISALQMNISGAKPSLSKITQRFIIKEFIERSCRTTLPCPTFVALQDTVGTGDVENIRNAFDRREGCKKDDWTFDVTPEGGTGNATAKLLYNSKIVDFFGGSAELVEEDFKFKGKTVKSDQDLGKSLFGRIAGGLFKHKESGHYIVAISYHGKTKSNVDLRHTFLVGILKPLCCVSLTELLSSLEKKYQSMNPLYLVIGDFNLHLEALYDEASHREVFLVDWVCCPQESITRTTGRTVHEERPVDYIMVKAPFNLQEGKSMTAIEFSPLPLTYKDSNVDDDFCYFSNKAGLIHDIPLTGDLDPCDVPGARQKTPKGKRF